MYPPFVKKSSEENLDDFVSDDDTPKDKINWQASGYDEKHLTISIGTDRAVLMVAPKDWYGTETVTFTASDRGRGRLAKAVSLASFWKLAIVR